jgi:hypothetical protein
VDGKKENLKDINLDETKHIMMDEFFGDFSSFKEETKAEVRNFIKEKATVWMALSNVYNGTKRLPAEVDDEKKT